MRHQGRGCPYLDRTEAVYASLVDGGRLGLCRANLTDNDALGLYSSFFSEVRPCRWFMPFFSPSLALSLFYFIYLFVFFRDHRLTLLRSIRLILFFSFLFLLLGCHPVAEIESLASDGEMHFMIAPRTAAVDPARTAKEGGRFP